MKPGFRVMPPQHEWAVADTHLRGNLRTEISRIYPACTERLATGDLYQHWQNGMPVRLALVNAAYQFSHAHRQFSDLPQSTIVSISARLHMDPHRPFWLKESRLDYTPDEGVFLGGWIFYEEDDLGQLLLYQHLGFWVEQQSTMFISFGEPLIRIEGGR